jgi:hypothetical protein
LIAIIVPRNIQNYKYPILPIFKIHQCKYPFLVSESNVIVKANNKLPQINNIKNKKKALPTSFVISSSTDFLNSSENTLLAKLKRNENRPSIIISSDKKLNPIPNSQDANNNYIRHCIL